MDNCGVIQEQKYTLLIPGKELRLSVGENESKKLKNEDRDKDEKKKLEKTQ